MIRTPKQAAEVWCRFARVARREFAEIDSKGVAVGRPQLIAGVNRDALSHRETPPRSCRCISTACMSWRWWDPAYVAVVVNPRDVKPETMARLAADGYERWPDGDRDGGHGYRMAIKTRRGYCGADSKPVHE